MILNQQHVTFCTRRVCCIQVTKYSKLDNLFGSMPLDNLPSLDIRSLFALHSEMVDRFDGNDFQLSQVVTEGQSDLNSDIGFGYFNLKDWCLVPFPRVKTRNQTAKGGN